MDKFEACIRLRQAMRDDVTREFLLKLLDGGGGRIEPVFMTKEGFRYVLVEETTGLDPKSAVELLENLHQLGVLKKVLYDKTIFCPNCGSPEISGGGALQVRREAGLPPLRPRTHEARHRLQARGHLVCLQYL